MRFVKEGIIIFFILIIVFLTEYITSKKLGDSIHGFRDGIISIENKINENKESEAQKEFYDLENSWKEDVNVLALFVEHAELEKISTDVAIIESNLETDETDKVLENIAELKFMLEHIEEKNQLKLKNVF